MVVTILALVFLVLIGFVVFVGYKTVMRRGPSEVNPNSERCSICRERFDKQLLTERQIGDYKLLYFCRNCILSLYHDIGANN